MKFASRSTIPRLRVEASRQELLVRRKWWLVGGALVAVAAVCLAFALGYACYHKGFHWGAFKDDCNSCSCSPGNGAVCTLLDCSGRPATIACKSVVDKRTGKSVCQPCRVHNEPAYDKKGVDPAIDLCCENRGLKVFSPPFEGKPGAGVPVCSSCRSTSESCNSDNDCCDEEDRCAGFVCTRDPGWRLGQ
jgi:hypothetical protein